MTELRNPAPQQIRQAQKILAQRRPAYEKIAEYYAQIFCAQAKAADEIQLDPVQLPADTLIIKQQEGFPLITLDAFSFDTRSADWLFREICRISIGAAEARATDAQSLLEALDQDSVSTPRLFTLFLEENDFFFKQTAEAIKIDQQFLSFVTYQSLRPSVTLSAAQVSTYLTPAVPWERGCCPICGSPPGLSMIEDAGARFLLCSFCWHKWSARRLYCPFCDNRDGNSLHYFYSETEPEYRVDVCDKCSSYIKGIDMRKVDRPVYAPLEQVATLHLDMQATQAGHTSGGPRTF